MSTRLSYEAIITHPSRPLLLPWNEVKEAGALRVVDSNRKLAGMASESSQDTFLAIPRQAKRGRTFVYVLRCRGEDVLKVGFSHDPASRLHTLHSKFHAFFDLDHSLLIKAGHLKAARRLERLFIERWSQHRAPAPLLVNPRACVHTEWFRGVGDSIATVASRLAERYGYPTRRIFRICCARNASLQVGGFRHRIPVHGHDLLPNVSHRLAASAD